MTDLHYDDPDLLGSTIATPFGAGRVYSVGKTAGRGANVGVRLGETKEEVFWSTEHGWEDRDAAKARYWLRDWDALSDAKREFITLLAPELEAKDKGKVKKVDQCYRLCLNRAIRRGILALETCTRCGGTGQFSYCQRFGTTCFGCHGKKKVYPSITKKKLPAIRRAITTPTNGE